MKEELDPKLIAAIKKITKTRAKRVVDHILEKGYITTEELRTIYGYDHPPRAARDVREEGIPLTTYRVDDSTGKKIGAYKFADSSKIENFKLGGRTTFSKNFKKELVKTYGAKCAITNTDYEERYLQIDHRIPFEVAGNSQGTDENVAVFMLLSGEGQRKKSWSCEHCENFLENKNIDICKTCYWAYPEKYTHLAMRKSRRIDLEWIDDEIASYEVLLKKAEKANMSLQNYIKSILKI